METFGVTLASVEILSASTLAFRFLRDGGESVVFTPGQFFRFTFTDEKGEFERSYSLCNYGSLADSSILDLVISRVEGGRATEYLFAAEPGVRAQVSGPYGRLLLPETLPSRLFMVATSVGIAPFLPMLAPVSEALSREELEVYFLFGVRDSAEFLYQSLLTDYAKAHPRFHLCVCYSRKMPPEPRPFEFPGYVEVRITALTPDPESDRFLLCGNPAMIDDTYNILKQRGFGPRQVTREKYVFARETGATLIKEMTAEQKQLLAEKMKKFQK